MSLWVDRAKTYLKAYMRQRLAWDMFGHDETATWGDLETTSSTQTWTSAGGAASDYSITGGIAQHLLTDTANRISALTSLTATDVTLKATLRVNQLAAGASIIAGSAVRYTDASNYYFVEVVMGTTQAITFRIRKRVGGVTATLSSITHTLTHSVGTWYGVTVEALGPIVRARLWDSSTDEPDTWDVEVDGQFDLTFGGVATRSNISGGNTNVNPTVEYGEITAHSVVDWIDITDYVLLGSRGQPIEGWVGRSTELSATDPSSLSFTLENSSGWFTANNAVSPYWPDWGTGVPIRWSETIGPKSFAFPDMWLEVPETSLTFEAAGDPELSDRVMRASCVDLLTRLNRAPRFVSNLAAYIIGEAAGGALRGYWPLTDPSGSTYASPTGPVNQPPLRFAQIDSFTPVRFVDSLVNFGNQDGPPGDDSTAVEFTSTSTNSRGRLGTFDVTNVEPTDSDIVTLVTWVYPTTSTQNQIVLLRDDAPAVIWLILEGNGSSWALGVSTFAGTGTLIGPEILTNQLNRWHLLGGQLDFATGNHTLWVDNSTTTGSLAGGGNSDAPMGRLVVDGGGAGDPAMRVAHAQVYLGDSSAFTHDDFLAQYDRGINGWPQQTVDARIRQVVNYAGIADSQLDLEESDSLIQAPAWSGQRPGDLAALAATTGGGTLFTRNDRLIYQDRKHRFNL